jgi:hypothetical protein
MAYPTIESVGQNSTSAGTSHAITLPSGVQTGDLLILVFATDGDNTITNWDTFTGLDSESNGTASFGAIGYRIATGSDACTIETSVSEPGSHVVYRISGHDSGQAPEASTVAEDTTALPDPTGVTPTGGAKDYLWIHACTWDRNRTVSAWNANFTLSRTYESGGGAGDCSVGISGRNENTTTKDPTYITISASDQWIAWTVAVHPVSATTAYKDIVFQVDLLSATIFKDITFKTTLWSPTQYKDITFKTSLWGLGYKDITFTTSLEAAGTTAFKDVTFQTTITDWYNIAWGYRKRIIIDSTKVAADHTDFPVLIYRATDSDVAEHCRSDGYDIVFTSGDGTTQLKHELDEFDSGTGEMWAWVKIPSLSSSKDTEIYMYYGNPAASDQQDKDNTWKTDYKGVFHLAPDDFTDSSGNANDASNSGTGNTTGKIGGGKDFINTESDYINLQDDPEWSFGNGVTDSPFTWSFWFTPDEDDRNQYMLIKLNEYFVQLESSGLIYVILYSELGTGNYIRAYTSASDIVASNTYRITVTYDGSGDWTKILTYINKTESVNTGGEGGTYVAMDDGANVLNSGRYNYFNGMLDELRISDEELTANWIDTEYENQNTPASFISVGIEQTILGFKDIVFKTTIWSPDQFKDIVFKTSLWGLGYKDITFTTSISSADTTGYKDIIFQTDLLSADTFKDIVFQTDLLSADTWKDIGFKTSLWGLGFKDVIFQVDLLSADTYKDIVFQTDLLSADTFKDIVFKTSLWGLEYKDITFKTSITSLDNWKDIALITSIASAETTDYKDIVFQTDIISADIFKDIVFQTDLLSATTFKDITFQTSIFSDTQYKDLVFQTSLLSADTFKDVVFQVTIISADQFKDIVFTTSVVAFGYKDLVLTSSLEGLGYKDISFITSLSSVAVYKDIVFQVSIFGYDYKDIVMKVSLHYPDIIELQDVEVSFSKYPNIDVGYSKSPDIDVDYEKTNEVEVTYSKKGIKR